MSLFCWTQRKIFWRMWETEQFWGTTDFHSIFFPTMEVNGALKQPGYKLSSKYLPLCSAEQRHSYRFGTTWGWVNDDRIFIFGWTIPLMFMSPPSGEHWATMVCMAELQEESHCSPKTKVLAKDHVDKPEDYWRKVMDGWNQNRTYFWFKWEAIMFWTHCIPA